MNLETKLEAILFYKGEPVSLKKLSEIAKADIQKVKEAIANLKNSLSSRGIVLVEKSARPDGHSDGDDEVMLATGAEFSSLIEELQKEDLNKELSKASLETLSIILYKNGAGRALIDYIRGVNSTFTLRALSVRGLVDRINDPKDNRRYIYKPSFELLQFMGVKEVSELPGYSEVNTSIEVSEKELEEGEQAEEN